jgi:uncharacterized protein (TIGR02186 family)
MVRISTPLAVGVALGLASIMPLAAPGEELVTAISDEVLLIDTAFDGALLSFAGEIRPGVGADVVSYAGAYHVVVVVQGPGQSMAVRRSSNVLGIWLNTEQSTFDDVPGFYWVLASGRLDGIVSEFSPSRPLLAPLPKLDTISGEAELGRELGRLMTQQGYFGVDEQGVQFRSRRLYTARLNMPHDLPTGLYLARTYVLRDGVVVARHSESFSVRVVGLERWLGDLAQQQPLVYGLACVLLALSVGWLGGVMFKR